MYPKFAVLLVLSALSALSAPPTLAQTPEALRDDYQRLQQWRFRAEPIAVPAGGLRWTYEGATWILESGRLWLQEPTSGGAVTGLVFEGKGRFQMAVPDRTELAQLRRFAKKPDLAGLDEPFSSLVLRTSGELPLQEIAVPPAGRFEVNRKARERHEQWLTQRLLDADSRVVAGLASPGDQYLRIDMDTDAFGWLTYDYDGWRIEEIRLESFNTKYPTTEVWLSLDRSAERDERGRPASRWQPALDIRHVDVAADLTAAGRDKDWYKGRFKVGVHILPQRDGDRAAQLYLHPFAKVTAVSEGGKPVPFLRDHVGKRSNSLDSRIYDASLVALVDPPLAKGAERRIDVEYELDMKGYASGRDWYPDAEGDETILFDTSTARLELTVRKKHQVRAMGRQEEGSGKEDGNTSKSVWIIDQPVKMLTFSFADYFHEETVARDGSPEVVCFGSRVQVSGKGKFRAVGEDIAESFAFYQDLFDVKLPEPRIQVTSIDGFHGQAFDGFIHLAEHSFDLLGPGAGELFRGHEAAHQFWGVLLGGATYRDAWIGEAFAEYSGMMFVEATMKDGPRHLRDVLQASRDELTGSIKSGFSKFSRMQVNIQNRAHGDRIGPIGHGWRANTGELPWAYSSQVYTKGALVLHMLRGMLRDATGSDQAFVDVLGDFLRAHQGGVASTRDFEAALARRVPGDWSWFF
ncbi:MAG TPA: M1 family aminopeptidase, partial [Thermoanaerobaculia bacterium]|nr:M1 family aminopeptidase [Thermoanaerobaculia bacterium]